MRALGVLLAVLLAGCEPKPILDLQWLDPVYVKCKEDAALVDARWARSDKLSREEVAKEIDELLNSNGCGAVTSWRVRKVMKDVLEVR
jgi:hypothetical protein